MEVLLPAAHLLGRRQVGEVGRWPSRVCITKQPGMRARPRAARRFGSIVRRSCDDIVAQHLAEAAGLEEIALHVDDEEARTRRIEFELVGFCPN